MLKTNRLKEKLNHGGPVFGLFVSIPSPIVVEMVAYAGFDFVILDTEHVLVNPQTLEDMIRAGQLADVTVLVRVSALNTKEILTVLDAGAQGVVVPNVESREEVDSLVSAAKYYPVGKRSMNSGRPGVFGAVDLVDYMQRANKEILLVPMIESQKGVENIDEIVAAPEVDMVLEGAADLSQSLGVPWQTHAPVVKEGINTVFKGAQQSDVQFCAIPRSDEDYSYWQSKGVQAFVLGDERGTAFRALQAKLEGTKKENRDGC